MLKSRMSFVVRDNQQNSRFFYHQTFYEDQSDGFCMMSVGSKFYLLYSYLIILLFQSFVPSVIIIFSLRTHGSARGGMDKKFKIMQ
jgi:hypothetical protein